MATKLYETAQGDSSPKALDPLLGRSAVCDAAGISVSTLYKKMSEGIFPKPVKIGSSAVRWRQSEVQAWLDSLQTTEAA